ncbi:MAG: hypothetical protein J3K34DRAFT_520428 [Monoraphidium minutum]|nr:MAG: hypothetical protein J3K34DRAFT_520428 [Monoraphidium minutum]
MRGVSCAHVRTQTLATAAPRAARRRARGPAAPAAAADGVDTIGFSALRLLKPSPSEIEELVATSFSGRAVNHPDAGASASAPDLPADVMGRGYMITTNRRKIGEGQKVYDAAVAAIKAWEQVQLGWNFTTKPPVKEGAKLCSATQTVVPWSVLPAQVVYSGDEAADFGGGDKGRRFAVGLASLSGHLLAGEERFSVELHADGSVWYDVFLFSRPNTILAWASLPVIKLMQLRYVNDSLSAVASATAA